MASRSQNAPSERPQIQSDVPFLAHARVVAALLLIILIFAVLTEANIAWPRG